MVKGNSKIEDDKKCRQIAGNFDWKAVVQGGVHCLMKHIQGYTGDHWMLPSGECLCHIAPAADMVNKIVEIPHNTTNKTHLLAGNYPTNWS